MTDPTTSPRPARPERVPKDVVAGEALRSAISTWEAAILALDGLDRSLVEAVRLRAGRHHDCLT